MEIIKKAADVYVIFRQGNQISTANNERQTLDDDIHRFISIALKTIPSAVKLFNNRCVFESLINALLLCVANDTDVVYVARAYNSVEKYFCLLVEQPWKQEYRTLKTYGGFYKTKVKSVLADAEIIFTAAGYVVDQDNKMVYERQEVDKRKLIILSFDCFVASEICKKIADQYNQLKTVGKTLDDAIFDILQKSWPRDISREKIAQKKSASKVIIPPEIPKREPLSNGIGKKISAKEVIYPTEPSPVYDANINQQNPEISLINFKFKHSKEPHIPYMDEDEHYPQLSEATPEEHIRESMKLVQQQKLKTEPLSDSWKYTPEAVPGISNPDSARTYPPGLNIAMFPYQQVPKENFYNKDKGVIVDINPNRQPGSTLNSSTSYTTSYAQSRSDQGYSTGHGFSNLSPIPSSQDMLSETIYRPPNIDPNGKIVSQTPLMQNPLPPPPVPSRELKPNYKFRGRAEDVVDGCYVVAEPFNDQRSKLAIPASAVYPPLVSEINAELRPPRSLHQLRSNSLKTEAKKLVGNDRVTKSMDYSFQPWICPRCSTHNLSAVAECPTCAFNKLSNEYGEAKKPCIACTFDNHWQNTNCHVCDQKLPEEVIYKK